MDEAFFDGDYDVAEFDGDFDADDGTDFSSDDDYQDVTALDDDALLHFVAAETVGFHDAWMDAEACYEFSLTIESEKVLKRVRRALAEMKVRLDSSRFGSKNAKKKACRVVESLAEAELFLGELDAQPFEFGVSFEATRVLMQSDVRWTAWMKFAREQEAGEIVPPHVEAIVERKGDTIADGAPRMEKLDGVIEQVGNNTRADNFVAAYWKILLVCCAVVVVATAISGAIGVLLGESQTALTFRLAGLAPLSSSAHEIHQQNEVVPRNERADGACGEDACVESSLPDVASHQDGGIGDGREARGGGEAGLWENGALNAADSKCSDGVEHVTSGDGESADVVDSTQRTN
jgi:hypothetical protein